MFFLFSFKNKIYNVLRLFLQSFPPSSILWFMMYFWAKLKKNFNYFIMKYSLRIKKVMFFFWYVQWSRRSKTKILTTTFIEEYWWQNIDVVTSQRSNSIQNPKMAAGYTCFRKFWFSIWFRAATTLHVSRKNITFCFNQG